MFVMDGAASNGAAEARFGLETQQLRSPELGIPLSDGGCYFRDGDFKQSQVCRLKVPTKERPYPDFEVATGAEARSGSRQTA